MDKVTFFFRSGHTIECSTADSIEMVLSILIYCACDLMIITDENGAIYPIELNQKFKAY